MIGNRELNDAADLLRRMLAALMTFQLPPAGTEGADLRRAVGNLLAHAEQTIKAGTIGTDLFDCFEKARLAGATLDSMDTVRNAMLAEVTIADSFSAMLAANGIVFSAVEQCQIVSTMTFSSRSDVDILMVRMLTVFENIKLDTSDMLDPMTYQNVVALAASLTQHLSATERQLPRIVSYTFAAPFPVLYLSNRIYADASRAEEILAENHVIHPAFVPRQLVALSF